MQRKMNIVFLHYGIYQGGDSNGWSRTYNLARGLAKLGHSVTLYTTSNAEVNKTTTKHEKDSGIQIKIFKDAFPNRFRKGGFSLGASILKIISIIRESDVDICIADNIHRPSCLFPALYLKLFCNVLIVSEWWELFGKKGIYSECSLFHKLTVGIYDLLFERSVRKHLCAGLVPISKFLQYQSYMQGFTDKTTCVLHSGIDHDILKVVAKKNDKSVSGQFRLGLIGANSNELLNNMSVLDACLELVSSGYDIKIRCSGEVSFDQPILMKYQPIIETLGWMDYKDFIDEMSNCNGYLLFQEFSVRNVARFPNKFGDYIGMEGFILSNCVGDLSEYLTKAGSPLIYFNCKADVKQWIKKMYHKEVQYRVDENFITENSWDARSRQLAIFLYTCLKVNTRPKEPA
jgi:hypothetical protein